MKNLTKTKVRGYQTQTKHDEYLRSMKKEEILKDGDTIRLKINVKKWGDYTPRKEMLKDGGTVRQKKEILKDEGIVHPKRRC